jgi:hypothetical protein
MRRLTRFLRVALLPAAVLAIVAGNSVSASASTLPAAPSAAAPSVVLPIHTFSMNW